MPRYAFWINDTKTVVCELDNPPEPLDVVDVDGGRYVVTIERPNHDETVDAAYTVEAAG